MMLQPELNGYKLSVGLGLNRGKVIEGEVGSSRRFDYTVIGDTVNVAWRLQELAGPGEILLTKDTLRPIQSFVSSRLGIVHLGKRRLLGRTKPVPIYRLNPIISKEIAG